VPLSCDRLCNLPGLILTKVISLNSDTASEDGQLGDADGEASDKSKHRTEEISSSSNRYNTHTKKCKLSKTD